MKKIINGKVYDTETAKEVGSTSANLSRSDFGFWSQELYRKRTGEYFLYGEGGPMSRYAVSCGQNEWSGGERIDPMTYDAAREWAEKNMDADDYEAEFGAVVEDDSKTHMCITISADLADKARKAAAANGITASEYIAELIKNA